MKKTIQYIVMFMCIGVSLYAQDNESEKSFQTISIGIQADYHANENMFHDYWKANTGYGVYVSTPFYMFQTQLGLSLLSFEPKTSNQPDCDGFYFYLQFEKNIPLFSQVNLALGSNFGIYNLIFDSHPNYTESLSNQSEREFAASLLVRLEISIIDEIAVEVQLSKQRVFWRRYIDYTYLSFGIQKTIETPLWLREVLE